MKRLGAGAMVALGAVLTLTSVTRAQEVNSTGAPQSNLSVVRKGVNGAVTTKTSSQSNMTKAGSGLSSGETRRTAKQQENVTFPGLPHPRPSAKIQPPKLDTRPLWALLRLRRYGALESRLELLKKYYPGWQPPADLAALLMIDRAAQTKNDRQMLAAYARWPQYFSCQRIGNLWKLADAGTRLGRADDSFSVYKKILATCTDEDDRLVTLSRTVEQFPPRKVEGLLAAETSRASGPKAARAYNDIRCRFYTKWLYASVNAAEWTAAEHAAHAIGPAVKARGDATAAAAIGWMDFKQNKSAAALPWFKASLAWNPKADTALGLALSLRALGKFDAVYEIASRFPHDQRLLALRQGILAQRAGSAYLAGEYAKVLNLVAKSARLGPLRPDVALFDGWAHYQKGDAAAAEAIFARLYRQSRDAPPAAGLIFSLIRLKRYRRAMDLAARFPGALTAILEPEKGLKLKTTKAPVRGLGATTVPPDTRYLFFSAWLDDATNARRYKTADWIVQKIEGDIRAKHSDRLNAGIGWVEINVKKYAAAAWFKEALADASPNWPGAEDAAYGLALAQLKAGDYDAAVATAQAWSGRFARLKQFYGEVLMEHARKAYGARDYKQSLKLARRAEAALPSRRDPKALASWNYYHLGELAQAESGFEALYRAQPDQQSASGLAYALQRMGDLDKLQRITQELGGPLRSLATDIVAQQDYNTDRFLRAASLAPKQFPDLQGIASPTFGSGFTQWSTSGSPGTSRLTGMAETTQAQAIVGLQRFTLDLDVMQLDAGAITPAQTINTVGSVGPGKPARFSPTTSLADGIEPMIGWSREGDSVSPFLQVGLTPLNGEVPSTVIGKAGASLLYGQTTATVDLIRRPITQSLLSFTGIRDPATGVAFGQVVESGGESNLFHQFSRNWGGTIAGRIGELTGQHVANNRDLSGSVGLDYSLNPEPFKYLSLGPSYQYESFQRNLSGFTFGNGGYYSPQWFHRIGLAANFQTRDSRRFVVKGTTFVGWQTATEDAAPLFPLHNNGAFTPATPSTGPNDFVALQGAYLLSSHWTLQGNVSYLASPQYNFLALGFQLRFSFEPREKLLSTDLWPPIEMTPVPVVP